MNVIRYSPVFSLLTTVFFSLITIGSIHAADGDYERYKKIFQPIPALPPVPADNTITEDKIKLGKILFWDRRTSKTGATSCGFCHHPAYYGAEPMRKSVGIDGEIHLRNAQTVLNAAFLPTQFWDGSAADLENQALGAIRSHVASRSWPKEVAERLNRLPEYKKLSMQAFGTPLTEENIGKAIATFMRTLITPDYPLARWLSGDESAMTEQQKNGMALFADKGCVACHAGAKFSNASFQKIIVPGVEHDKGVARKTKDESDDYRFKVPSLLNVAMTPPYTHAGIINSLEEMVKLMGDKMLKQDLTKNEVADIVAFLNALTGKMPNHFLEVPVLPIGGGEGDFGPGLLPSGKN